MHQYGVREVEKLLHLPRSTIRAFIQAGFVAPSRGPRNAWLFSFQDLIVLRTAQALAAAKVSSKRITRSVKELRRHLPDSMPLSGLSICAVADRVVVKEGGSRWQAETGQYLLAFEGDPAEGSLSVIDSAEAGGAHVSCERGGTGGAGGPHALQVGGAHTPCSSVGEAHTPRSSAEGAHTPRTSSHTLRAPQSRAPEANGWFERGLSLESQNPDAAVEAYERAIAADPTLVDAHINLGLLLHQVGHFARAERVYRDAIKANGSDPVLLYNLGVLLEDMDRTLEAMESYEASLRGNPGLADCHYNLALLCEELKKPKDAIRHMAQYRRLLEKRDG